MTALKSITLDFGELDCGECGGDGRIQVPGRLTGHKLCRRCDGSGTIPLSTTFDLTDEESIAKLKEYGVEVKR